MKHDIQVQYIQPGKPMQNGYIERLNRTFREDVLDAYQFDTLEEVRMLCDEWQYQYNHHHPHGSLGGKTPFMARMDCLPATLHRKQMIEQEQRNHHQQQNKQSLPYNEI